MEQFFQYAQVKNPQYFKVGCQEAHSDHRYYRSPEEMKEERSSFLFSLNGFWKFHYAKNYEMTVKGFAGEDYSCKNWDSIRVPAHIQMEGYDAPQYVNVQYPWEGREDIAPGEIPKDFNPVASYVKYFQVPEHMKKERIFLLMEGVESAAAIWLNGVYMGYHEDSFTPLEIELTKELKEGENKLAVQVFKWSSGSWCEDQDFFRFSGIYRDVYLRSQPKTHIQDMRVEALPDESLKRADLSLSLRATGKGKACISLIRQGTLVFREERETRESFYLKKEIDNPLLWSAECPHLYDLLMEIYDEEGNLQECICEKVGFRRFEIKDSLMCINGKRIVFCGVNRHEFSSVGGRRVLEEELKKDLATIKKNNINAIRTSHYPNASMLYRLCDIYGIYLIDEMNLETHGTWERVKESKDYEKIIPNNHSVWQDALLARAQAMYERDKNHPCILIWSCGNESFGGSVIYQVSQYFRKKDSSRLVHYEGIFADRTYPDTSDIESQMYTPTEEIERFLEENPKKPFICCEYTHAMGNSCGGMYKYRDLSERVPLYQGGFIWDYIDQSLYKKNRYGEEFQAYGGDFYDRPCDYSFCGNGIVYGADREPSPKMQEIKFLYQPISVKVTEEEAEIYNKNLFVNTREWECRVLLEREGQLLDSYVLETDVEPLSRKSYPLKLLKPSQAGEYVITLSFCLRENRIWAQKGHEIAFGQCVYKIEEEEKEKASLPSLKLVKSERNIGIRGEDFEVLFSLQSGGLVSYRYGGRELMEKMPRPNFWRAPIENDFGNLMPMRYAQWKIASLYGAAKIPKAPFPETIPALLERGKDYIKVAFVYHLPTTPQAKCLLTYQVYGDGRVLTSLEYDPVKELGDMPEFGLLFTLNADYDQVTWYGLGPLETYADRKCGGKLGLYKNKVEDNMAAYLVPQECGNKEEVRYAKITDRRGRGILFSAENERGSMSFSALPYTPHRLEEADHAYELGPIHHTIVRLSLGQMGVGGDNSWGARTHKEHLLPTDRKLRFQFSFRGI